MPYRADISRANPSCFLFMVDQSGSMKEPLGSEGAPTSKAQAVADSINSLLQNLVSKCTKSDGIRDYYHAGVIGYGGAGVVTAFGGQLAKNDLVPISLIGNSPARVERRVKTVSDGQGGTMQRPYSLPIWIDPVAGGGTPMCAALNRANTILRSWLPQHPDCFPPIVINISDGESTDGSATAAARELTSLASKDGQVLLFNIHLSSFSQKPAVYPDSDLGLEDAFAKELFQFTSPLTSYMRQVLAAEGYQVTERSRGLVVHGDMSLLIRFLDVGTRPANIV